MRRLLWLCLLLWAGGPATAQEVKYITFRTLPDCRVVLQVSGTSPFVLGESNRPLPLDMELFDKDAAVRITFEREGWSSETRVLQQPPVRSRYFDTRDTYPEPGEGPVRLTPLTDPGSRWLQVRYLAGKHTRELVVALLGLAVAGWWGLRRFRRLQEAARKGARLEALTATIDAPDGLAGSRLGPYRLLEPLGRGGMATVYRGVPEETLTERDEVAVKVLRLELLTDARAVKRFQREIQVYLKLAHPNLLRILDWGEDRGVLYLVTELLKGKTVRQALPELSQEQAVDITLGVLAGLTSIHKLGVVHRDVKPDNTFLTDKNEVKLMDFGVARADFLTAATATGHAVGTPAYMAPELMLGKFDERSDLYATGVMLYEMLAGEPPFWDPDPAALQFMHTARSPAPLPTDVPEPLAAFVLKLLEKHPEARYPDATTAAEALRRATNRPAASPRTPDTA